VLQSCLRCLLRSSMLGCLAVEWDDAGEGRIGLLVGDVDVVDFDFDIA
jgi:hypothetical protein